MQGILKSQYEVKHYGIKGVRKYNNEVQQRIREEKLNIVRNISKIAKNEHWYTQEEKKEIEKYAEKGLFPCCVVYANRDLNDFAFTYHAFVKKLAKNSNEIFPFKVTKELSRSHSKYIFYANDNLRQALEENNYGIFSRCMNQYFGGINTDCDVFIVEGENLYLFESCDKNKRFSHQYTRPLTQEALDHSLWLDNICQNAREKRILKESQKSSKSSYPIKPSKEFTYENQPEEIIR